MLLYAYNLYKAIDKFLQVKVHWRSGTAWGFIPQGRGFISHPVDRTQYNEPVRGQ